VSARGALYAPPAMRLRPLVLVPFVALGFSACGGPPPVAAVDIDAVASAQQGWCEMLARVAGHEKDWSELAACKAATPAGSAAFVKLATKCYEGRVESYGANAPDQRLMADECKDEVVFQLPDDGGRSRFVVEARCERMLRCEKVAKDECLGALDRLDPSQLAVFTKMYNMTALGEVKRCLEDDCSGDEEAARTACYEPLGKRLLWFPL
jgi:hypothetical protein